MAKKTKMGTAVESAVGSLGDYLREQRVAAELTLRQLAEQTGVSNPYLSQIERGLRKPSADVLQQLAKALRISAEQIYVQAGILSAESRNGAALRVEPSQPANTKAGKSSKSEKTKTTKRSTKSSEEGSD